VKSTGSGVDTMKWNFPYYAKDLLSLNREK
jgi:hypothetical protein